MKRAARFIIFYSALLGLWTLLAELKIWPPYLFPTPWGVAEALYAGFQDHTFWIAIRVSLQRGQLIERVGLPPMMATVHPSSILRAPDDETRELEMRAFVQDLKRVAQHLGR